MSTDEMAASADYGAPRFASEMVVAVEEITQRYGPRIALEKLSLTLREGEVFGLVGANGGGKTTTLRILAGILKPDLGRGRVLGFDVMRDAKEIRERVGYMSQRFSLYADLSVFENLRFRAELYGLKRPRAEAENAIDCFELREYARSPSAQLSGGWARRLQLAAALDSFAETASARRADRGARCDVPPASLATHRTSGCQPSRSSCEHP